MDYSFFKLTLGAIATVGLYSVLYRENKVYRLFEHIFLGLAAGWSITALWTEVLKDVWWDKMVGRAAEGGDPAQPGYWLMAILPFIGLLGYFVFSQKHNWASRIPIGILLGLWAGQQFEAFTNRFTQQIADSLKPILPTTSGFLRPDTSAMTSAEAAEVATRVYGSQALSNIIFVVTLLSVLSYFLFSFDVKGRFLRNTTTMGRWLLMIGFGAIFGSTVMMRFSLLIDRMYFVFIEWLMQGLLGRT
ncbi:MAG TPA: hypothetical protein VGE01_00250 [Fimbriimonas sp.]